MESMDKEGNYIAKYAEKNGKETLCPFPICVTTLTSDWMVHQVPILLLDSVEIFRNCTLYRRHVFFFYSSHLALTLILI